MELGILSPLPLTCSSAVPDNNFYMMSGGNGTGRESLDITSALDSLTDAEWQTATEESSSDSDISIETGVAGV